MNRMEFPQTVSAENALSRFELFKTRDLDEARAWGTRVFCENSLRCHGGGAIDASMYYRKMCGLGVGRLGYGADVTIEPGELDAFYLVQMTIRGRESVECRGETASSTPRAATVINARRPARVRHAAETEKLILRIDRDALERHCQQHLGRGLRGPVEFRLGMPLDGVAGQRWMALMGWLYDTLSKDDECMSPMLLAQTEQMVITSLLSLHEHNYSQALCDEAPRIAPGFVKRVEQYIEAHAHEPVTIIELAEHAGVSSRSIYAGFRRYRDASPMLYLKEIRLRRVNEELMHSDAGETTVTAVAYKWGFGHLGHFTTDYKRRFGESPSQTLMR